MEYIARRGAQGLCAATEEGGLKDARPSYLVFPLCGCIVCEFLQHGLEKNACPCPGEKPETWRSFKPSESNLRIWQVVLPVAMLLVLHLASRDQQIAFFLGERSRWQAVSGAGSCHSDSARADSSPTACPAMRIFTLTWAPPCLKPGWLSALAPHRAWAAACGWPWRPPPAHFLSLTLRRQTPCRGDSCADFCTLVWLGALEQGGAGRHAGVFIVFFNVYQGVKEVSPVVLANA